MLPLFTLHPVLVLIGLVGAAIGSLFLDEDCKDAASLHKEVRGVKQNTPAILYPAFGQETKYLIYKPVVTFNDIVGFSHFDIDERQRGLLHSFLGFATRPVVTGLYLIPVLFILELFSIVGLAVFLVAYLAGAVVHLLEDSCTKLGIQQNFPFQSWKIRGRLTTTPKPKDTKYQRGFLTVLGAGAGAMFFIPSILDYISVYLLSSAGLVNAVVLWAGFSVGVARCRIDG